jgi:hypothetical protein
LALIRVQGTVIRPRRPRVASTCRPRAAPTSLGGRLLIGKWLRRIDERSARLVQRTRNQAVISLGSEHLSRMNDLCSVCRIIYACPLVHAADRDGIPATECNSPRPDSCMPAPRPSRTRAWQAEDVQVQEMHHAEIDKPYLQLKDRCSRKATLKRSCSCQTPSPLGSDPP